MAWVTPKTNWVQSDYLNIADYSRIVGNLKYLNEYAKSMYGDIEYQTVPEQKYYQDIIWFSEFTNIEKNLENLNLGTYSFDIGTTKTYYANDHTPDYNELNRIESATLELYKTLKSQHDLQPHLAFTLGGGKQFRVPRT